MGKKTRREREEAEEDEGKAEGTPRPEEEEVLHGTGESLALVKDNSAGEGLQTSGCKDILLAMPALRRV